MDWIVISRVLPDMSLTWGTPLITIQLITDFSLFQSQEALRLHRNYTSEVYLLIRVIVWTYHNMITNQLFWGVLPEQGTAKELAARAIQRNANINLFGFRVVWNIFIPDPTTTQGCGIAVYSEWTCMVAFNFEMNRHGRYSIGVRLLIFD